MKLIFLSLLFCVCSIHAYTQAALSFKPLRFNDDFSYLANDSSSSWYTHLKYTPLSGNKAVYISVGGDLRYQYFYVENDDWGEAPKDKDGYILTRYLVHADFHAGKNFRTFIQLQSSLANGMVEKPSPVDENQLAIHQAFVDITPWAKQKHLLMRLGRQELLFGSQRLVSVREGPNNRQSFDAAKFYWSERNIRTEVFYSHYVKSKQGIFDDGFNKSTAFWGSYIVFNKIPVLHNADVYYLGLRKTLASFDDGKGREIRHSVGARIWHQSKAWQYDFEGLYQWGKFGTGSISAWTLSSNTSYTFYRCKLQPEINLKTELISGDRLYDDNKLQTFNPLFPRGGYFGLAALIGPSNLMDIHPAISISPLTKLKWSIDYDAFWRYSSHDGIYGPNVALIYSGKSTREKNIGQQLSTDLVFIPNRFLYFRGEFTWFRSGNFLKAVGPGKDIYFAGITSQIKF